ncbi:unnamed protein product [Chironomus riparius]|uniref:Uncharacterized protein n=1 Tax=Chironomus riparius TaxID=315576 RepID=A0A9N9RJP5_9DIPT|nr:unnamed protein product [Chironomus riparius]
MNSKKCSAKENQNPVRKSILRYPEVPLNNEQINKNKRITVYGPESSKRSENTDQKQSRKSLHEPTINKLAEWRKVLDEVKNYSTKEVKDMNDVSKTTQDFINRAVSLKLNFPTTETVFKNLPKIEDESTKETNRFMQKLSKKEICGKNKDDIQMMLNEIVEAEYRCERKNVSQSSTDEWLKINKFNEPSYKMPNIKSETEMYNEQLRKDLYHYLFTCDDYISTKVTFDPSSKPDVYRKDKDCKCMTDFYTQHSMCS